MSTPQTARKPAPRKAFLPLGRRQHNVTQNAHNADRERAQTRAPQDLVGRGPRALPEPAARPTFVLRLEARPGVSGVRALRWLLKVLARQHGFRCVSVEEGKRQGRR